MVTREEIFPEFGKMETKCNKLYSYLYHAIDITANQNTGKPIVLATVFSMAITNALSWYTIYISRVSCIFLLYTLA